MTETEYNNLIASYEKLVFTVCYQFVKDYSTAEDLTQETFLSAYTHRNSCPPNAEKPWLVRIASNKAKDYLKSAYNRRVIKNGCDDESVFAARPDVSIYSRPEDLVISQCSENNIKQTILTLKEPYLKVSVMFFIEEKSIDEISAALNRPCKTVHTQLYRAKHILQDLLKGEMKNE